MQPYNLTVVSLVAGAVTTGLYKIALVTHKSGPRRLQHTCTTNYWLSTSQPDRLADRPNIHYLPFLTSNPTSPNDPSVFVPPTVWSYLPISVHGSLACREITDFSAAERVWGVKFSHACWPTIRIGLLPFPRSKVKGQGHQGQKTRLALRSPTRFLYEWYAPWPLRRRRTSAFAGGRGVTLAAACTEARNWGGGVD